MFPPDPWTHPIFIAGAIAVAVGALIALEWVMTPTRPHPERLPPGLLGRWWRNYRWFWFRIGLNAFAWPHVFDVVLGTRKAEVAQTPNEIIWEHGPATLRRYGSRGAKNEVVLVVHSLVSKPWILDLAVGRSLIGSLVDEGFDVFLLDWGDPGRAEVQLGLSQYSDILMEAEKQVLMKTRSEALHLVGYCLGGLICLLRAAARSHTHVASLVLIATPVDFSVRVGLQPLIANRLFKPAYFLDGSGCVPSEALRESFHVLRPQALRTVLGAWRRRDDRDFRQMYDPLARWVWEHRPLTGAACFDLVELFRTNGVVNERLVISGEVARLNAIEAPILSLIAEHDHIVPSSSSHALSDVEGIEARVAAFDTGHVSMISGRTAQATVWPAIAEWIKTT